jgi:transposase
MPTRRSYSTDLSDEEWEILQPLVPDAKPGGRPRAHETRELLNAIFYVLRGGCAWRLLPHDFHLPWQTAYHYGDRAAQAQVGVGPNDAEPEPLPEGFEVIKRR